MIKIGTRIRTKHIGDRVIVRDVIPGFYNSIDPSLAKDSRGVLYLTLTSGHYKSPQEVYELHVTAHQGFELKCGEWKQ